MKAFRLILVILFIPAFALIACSDDESPTSTGGTPPPDTNSSNVCNSELCRTNAALRQECEEFLSRCLQVEDEDECVGGAWVICQGK